MRDRCFYPHPVRIMVSCFYSVIGHVVLYSYFTMEIICFNNFKIISNSCAQERKYDDVGAIIDTIVYIVFTLKTFLLRTL